MLYICSLPCKCERLFMSCLKKVNTMFATAMGNGYDMYRHSCYDYAHPIKKCKRTQTIPEGFSRCVKYEFDKTKPKIWQFFYVPYFRYF